MSTTHTTLGIAINYTPPGSDLDLTLAIVRDPKLLIEAMKNAIMDADRKAQTESNPVAANGYRTQRNYLLKFLQELTQEWAGIMMKPELAANPLIGSPQPVSELLQ